MKDGAIGIPLAFMLALSTSSTGAVGIIDQAEQLVPGSLSKLLPEGGQGVLGRVGDQAGFGETSARIAQWFNWMNCFSGYWRRC